MQRVRLPTGIYARLGRARERLAGRELLVLAFVLAIALSLWAFVALADAVIDGGTHAFDRRLLLALRTPGDTADPIGPPWLEEAMRDATGLGGNLVLTLASLAAAGFLRITGRARMAAMFLASVGAALAVNMLMKAGFDRPRPDLVAHAAPVFTRSFPSSHATMSAIVYLTLGAFVARTQASRTARLYIIAVALLVTLLVGFSRVYLGVHWPTDVLAGWAIGAAWALASVAVLIVSRRRSRALSPPPPP